MEVTTSSVCPACKPRRLLMPSDRRNSGADRSAAGLDLRGLRRVFHGQPVIEDLSLDVRPGEFLALLGPSGCGKSTLLRLIAGLDPPDGGEIAITGAEPSLAYVFQDASLMPWRTVLGNVVLPLELAGQPRGEREAAARALLDAVGLSSAAPRYPCGEMHRTADAGGPLCRTTGPFRGAQRVDPPGRDSLGVASPTVR